MLKLSVLLSTISLIVASSTAQAATIVQTVPSSGPIDSDTINFDPFDSTEGTLTSVVLDYNLTSDVSLVSVFLCQTFQDCAPGQAGLFLTGSGAFSSLNDSDLSGEFGWTNNTEATQTANPDPLSVSGSVNFVNLGDFVDTLAGDVSWNYNGNIFGFNDIEAISSDGSFTLTYEFTSTSTSTPEPTTTLGLIGLGMMGLSRLRKKTK
ncbi:MAG: PEP-CTERM sorting domain-containing protein [Crocosphaera sp.]